MVGAYYRSPLEGQGQNHAADQRGYRTLECDGLEDDKAYVTGVRKSQSPPTALKTSEAASRLPRGCSRGCSHDAITEASSSRREPARAASFAASPYLPPPPRR